jgi:protease YdgD
MRFALTDQIDGLDWAFLRLDQPLGSTLGYATVRRVDARAMPGGIMQAGYAWDTGETLSGHVSCRMLEIRLDNTFLHTCDTTRGDSGSGILVRNGDGFDLIGIDSAFSPNISGPDSYVAVGAGSFAAFTQDFIQGQTGTPVGPLRPPKLN